MTSLGNDDNYTRIVREIILGVLLSSGLEVDLSGLLVPFQTRGIHWRASARFSIPRMPHLSIFRLLDTISLLILCSRIRALACSTCLLAVLLLLATAWLSPFLLLSHLSIRHICRNLLLFSILLSPICHVACFTVLSWRPPPPVFRAA